LQTQQGSPDSETGEGSGKDTIIGLKVGAYVTWGIMVIFMITIICICRQIKIAIEVVKCAADFVKETP